MIASPAAIELPSIIAARSTAPTQNPARSYSPWPIHVRHFRGFAADQRGAGLRAAFRNAGDHACGDVDIEPAAGEVVEEKQRLCALHQHIVDAHGDQVDANRVVLDQAAAQASAWCRHRQCRIPARVRGTARRQCEQAAKTAQPGQHFGSLRALHQRLDALDEFVAGIDVDAGIFIGQ